MTKLSDKELIEELQYRFSQNKKSLEELSALTKQLQMLNNKLKESEKIKSQFLSNIRNEMNNPLASILGLSKNIQSVDPVQWEKAKSMAALIHTEAFSLDFQLKNIFAAAELESGELVLEAAQVDIYSLIGSVLDMFAHQIKAKQLQIIYTDNRQAAEKRLFKTDAAKLQLILSNLIANAIEYSYAHSEIVVKIYTEKDSLAISVQDFGIGMHKAEQEVIFNPFTQLNTGITKLHKGNGLGLSVTKALIDILNGRIDINSIAQKGSTFIVSVPELTREADQLATDGNELFFHEGELF